MADTDAFASIAALTLTLVDPPEAIRMVTSLSAIEASKPSAVTPPDVVTPLLGDGSVDVSVPDEEDVMLTRADGFVPEGPTTARTCATVAPAGPLMISVLPERLRPTEEGAEYRPIPFVTRRSSI